MGNLRRPAILLALCALVLPLVAQAGPRSPVGIYAIVNVSENIKKVFEIAEPAVSRR